MWKTNENRTLKSLNRELRCVPWFLGRSRSPGCGAPMAPPQIWRFHVMCPLPAKLHDNLDVRFFASWVFSSPSCSQDFPGIIILSWSYSGLFWCKNWHISNAEIAGFPEEFPVRSGWVPDEFRLFQDFPQGKANVRFQSGQVDLHRALGRAGGMVAGC